MVPSSLVCLCASAYLFCSRSAACLKWFFGRNFPTRCCGVFGQVQAASSLNSLDDGFRAILGTSAREIVSFCEIANLPDLSVGALTAPTVFSEDVCAEAFPVLCCAAPWFALVCFRMASIRPASASRRFAMQWLCVASSLVFNGRFPVLAMLLCSLGRFPVFSVFSLRWSWRACFLEMLTVFLRPWETRSCFLECDGCGFWRIIVCISPLMSHDGLSGAAPLV